jgi:hypothetical protein
MEQKAVIVLCDDLPTGLKANIAAVMGMSLGRYKPDLVGPEALTGDGTSLPGITTIPVPILTADQAGIDTIFVASRGELEMVVPFGTAALTTKNYDDYTRKLATLADTEQGIKGLLLLGPKKRVNKIVGQLPLLR